MMNPYSIPGVKIDIRTMTGTVRVEFIKQKICEYLNITIDEVRTERRLQKSVYARFLMMYFLRKHTKLSYKQIGLEVRESELNHASVIHGIEKVEEQLIAKYDNEFKVDVPKLYEIIGL